MLSQLLPLAIHLFVVYLAVIFQEATVILFIQHAVCVTIFKTLRLVIEAIEISDVLGTVFVLIHSGCRLGFPPLAELLQIYRQAKHGITIFADSFVPFPLGIDSVRLVSGSPLLP